MAWNLGPELRRLRNEQGLTLADLSRRLMERGAALSVSTLSKIEIEDRRLQVDDFIEICLAMELHPGEVLKLRLAWYDTMTRGVFT